MKLEVFVCRRCGRIVDAETGTARAAGTMLEGPACSGRKRRESTSGRKLEHALEEMVRQAVDVDVGGEELAIDLTDPRELTPVGPPLSQPMGDNPHGKGDVVVDTRKAILGQDVEVALLGDLDRIDAAFSIVVGGRINRTQDRAQVMLLGPVDFAAALVAETIGVYARAPVDRGADFQVALEERIDKMKADGNMERGS